MRESSYIQRIDSILRILKFGGVPNIFRVLLMPIFFLFLWIKIEIWSTFAVSIVKQYKSSVQEKTQTY